MPRAGMALLTALISGGIFGFGLAIARMTDPEKIKDFLDLAAIPTGGWDPSLAFVMAGGLAVAGVGLRLDRWLRAPLAAARFARAERPRIDRPLVAGAAVFGIGWGLSGLCPGPAIADLGIVPGSVTLFVAAMLAGSWATGKLARSRRPETIATAGVAARSGRAPATGSPRAGRAPASHETATTGRSQG
jgi:uncharacterized membrane protein YedE/YeeE